MRKPDGEAHVHQTIETPGPAANGTSHVRLKCGGLGNSGTALVQLQGSRSAVCCLGPHVTVRTEAGRVQALGFSNFEIRGFETDRWAAIANDTRSGFLFFYLNAFIVKGTLKGKGLTSEKKNFCSDKS